MTLTKTQIFHRTESLSGEIKAAREAQSECRKALADQERLTHIAAQAVERADARVAELEAERAELAEQARVAILGVGEVVVPEAPTTMEWSVQGDVTSWEPSPDSGSATFNSIFTEGADFQAQAMQNGLDRIGEIVDEARR